MGNKWNDVRDKKSVSRDSEYNLAGNVKQNPKAFWKYSKSKMQNRSKLGDLKMVDGKLTGDDKTRDHLLNSLFVGVFTRGNKEIPDLELEPKYQSKDSFNVNSFTADIIEKKLEVTKSAGPDGFHLWLLSEISTSIKLPLSISCKKSYDEGPLPLPSD